jgi:DNA-directed RNA polymerase subunit RPC12/RpoP
MPIEFACSSCQQTVRVSDAAAGKKGRCPKCGSILDIPMASSAAPAASAPAPARPKPTAVPAKPAAAAAPKPAPKPAAPPASQSAPKPAAKVSGSNVSFTCPSCTKPIVAPAALTGKKGKCPHCQAKVVIGGASPPATDGLEPLGPGDLAPLGAGDLAPLGAGDLSPLGPSGLAPMGGGTGDLFADLPPMGPAANSPFGGQPLPNTPPLNPLGAAPSPYGSPSPYGAASPNPYASPSPFGASSYGGAMHGAGSASGAPATLMIPAIGMIVVSGITILMWCFAMLNMAIGVSQVDIAAEIPDAEEAQVAQGVFYGVIAGYATAGLLIIAINGVVINGAVQMIRLRNWNSAKMSAGLGIVPCSALCLNIPLGIWALVVLNQPEVKRLFRD